MVRLRILGTSLLVVALSLMGCKREEMPPLRLPQSIVEREAINALNTYFEGLVNRAGELIDDYGKVSDPMKKSFSIARVDSLKGAIRDYEIELRVYLDGNPPLEQSQISTLKGLISTLNQYSSGERDNMADRYPERFGNE